MTTREFKSDPINRLGIENAEFQSNLMQVSFASPAQYFAIRKECMKKLLTDGIKDMHATIYNFLTEGTDKANVQVVTLKDDAEDVFGGANNFKPKLNKQKADEVAMSIVSGYQKLIMDEVLDLVLPASIFSEALQRSAKKATVDSLNE
jgi:hypothetical protein